MHDASIRLPGGPCWDHDWCDTRRTYISELITAIKTKHDRLKKKGYLWSGVGLQLQFIDSEIAEQVMLEFARQDKPIIPIHDSFIVKAEDEELLRQGMITAYQQHPLLHGLRPVVKKSHSGGIST